VIAVKGVIVALALAFAVGTLSTVAAPVSASKDECPDDRTWPSFAEVARTARSIYLVEVTHSVDDVAEKASLVEVMRGAASEEIDLRRLQPGSTRDGCPAPIGPYAQVGDRLLIAYDGTAPDRVGSIDTVAHVGRMRDGRNLSGLERLTIEEAQAYDAPSTRRQAPKASPTPTPARWSPRPSSVPAAAGDTDVLWSCRGDPPGFPRSVLTGPTGMEKVEGAVFDGLRSALETMRSEFEFEPREDRPHQLPWLLAYEDEDLALFLVRRLGDGQRYSAMYVEREGGTWGFAGYTDDCQPRPLITHGLGSSEWRVDPESPPTPGSSTFPIEVMEHACASGRPADGRIADPIEEYGEDAITITVPVRGVAGAATCPGNPWTPFVLELDEPIGDRRLLDGGPWPPEQRWPLP
jgi:hypothetical protein